ncbi:hypothetical protein MTR67_027077 [Solanum verrucosum]|uniref:Uncharacterized protein n=1 Tax=Solanum verrucosum TaxID=315347 RepID=A0AAF0R4C6_SOLVR|nr:hypothetical protein MTR67_027077 [Solanum verrucosum]
MDFIVGLPRTRQQYDLIWVIVDRMTKLTHFILVKVSYTAEDYAKLYLRERDGFAYNNSYQSSIGMIPFESLYGKRCRSPIGWFEVCDVSLIGPELFHEAIEKDLAFPIHTLVARFLVDQGSEALILGPKHFSFKALIPAIRLSDSSKLDFTTRFDHHRWVGVDHGALHEPWTTSRAVLVLLEVKPNPLRSVIRPWGSSRVVVLMTSRGGFREVEPV